MNLTKSPDIDRIQIQAGRWDGTDGGYPSQNNIYVDELAGSVLNSVSTLQDGQQLRGESSMGISAYYDVPGERIAAARDSLANIRSEGGDIDPSYQDEMM